MDKETRAARVVMESIAAPFLAFICYLLVSVVATAAYYFVNVYTSVVKPEVVAFFAGMAGSTAGVFSGKAACDNWLPLHKPRIVFVAMALILGAMMGLMLALLPLNWDRAIILFQLGFTIWLCYVVFWIGD